MIKFVTGKPGGGKTLRVMQLVFDYLQNDPRPIVTNLPLHLDRIQEYCDERQWGVDVEERILLLNDDNLRQLHPRGRNRLEALRDFYLYRSKGIRALMWDKGQILDWSALYKDHYDNATGYTGTIFMIDEVHKLWPSRAYQSADQRVFEYLAEHRHLGDDVIFISQALAQLDKQIRLLGQDFEVMRNRSKEKYQWFAGPKEFVRSVYLHPPTGSRDDQPSERTRFRLNVEQANCYETSAQGGSGDKGQSAKGLPYPLLWGGLAAVAFLLWFVVTRAPGWMLGIDKDKAPEITARTVAIDPAPTVSSTPQTATGELAPEPEEPKFYRSLGILGDNLIVILEDGRILKGNGGEIQSVTRDKVVILENGNRLYPQKLKPTKHDQYQESRRVYPKATLSPEPTLY